MYGFIYLTTNLINGKKYVGMCKNTHRDGYLGSGKMLKFAIRKYGKENFTRSILQECDTFEQLSESEKFWIEKYDAVNSEHFYNLTPGGFGGNSDYLKSYWMKLNKEERRICRKWNIRDMKGDNNPMYGKKHSQKTKTLIGSKSVNRNWNKPDHNGKNNPRSKRVSVNFIGQTQIKFYECLKDFFNEYNSIPYSTMKSLAQNGNFSKKYGLTINYV